MEQLVTALFRSIIWTLKDCGTVQRFSDHSYNEDFVNLVAVNIVFAIVLGHSFNKCMFFGLVCTKIFIDLIDSRSQITKKFVRKIFQPYFTWCQKLTQTWLNRRPLPKSQPFLTPTITQL